LEVIVLLFLFSVKHVVADFFLQGPYQYLNKGNYGHPGGILHSAIHALFTLAIVVFFAPIDLALGAALFDFVVHYHVDWAKTRINAKFGWGANTHTEFWYLLGVDQFLHTLTYLIIAWILITY
jgi:hypothetical protein